MSQEGSRVGTPKWPDLGPVAGPSTEPTGARQGRDQNVARRDAKSAAGPEKFNAEGPPRESQAGSPVGPPK